MFNEQNELGRRVRLRCSQGITIFHPTPTSAPLLLNWTALCLRFRHRIPFTWTVNEIQLLDPLVPWLCFLRPFQWICWDHQQWLMCNKTNCFPCYCYPMKARTRRGTETVTGTCSRSDCFSPPQSLSLYYGLFRKVCDKLLNWIISISNPPATAALSQSNNKYRSVQELRSSSKLFRHFWFKFIWSSWFWIYC